jgi:uncharacterized protein YegJ (DUF2314 family)
MGKNQEEKGKEYYQQSVGKICSAHADAKLAQYQAATDNKYKKRDYIQAKLKVCEKGCYEHLWVWVLDTNEENKTISGTVANEPMHEDSIIRYGQVITVPFEIIQSLIPHTYNVSDN